MTKQGVDPATRTLELLWERIAAPTRGPKPTLTLDEIVGAAIEIADRDGLGDLSMRRVAEALGFTTMSLYRYLPGKEELVELMRDKAVGRPPAHRRDASWRAALQRWARADLEVHLKHPWLLEVEIRRPPFGPNHLAWLDAGLAAIEPLSLDPLVMLNTVLAVDSYVRGAARIRVGTSAEQRRSRATRQELARLYAGIFEQIVTDERYPALAKIVTAGVFDPAEKPIDEFEFGLDRVLDGVAAFVEP
ncbi:MAG: TetR/AcrR family transcriptional regulator [Polyangiaceae bacterium]|nr:TetR/AcrR family transcriptional regulator [Polyangiaceae bacterium]